MRETKISDIGEEKVIEIIFSIIDKETKKITLPYGDDAVAIKLPGGKNLVINVDMLVGKTDIPPGMSNVQIGKKVVTMCVSDLAAKGAKPIGFLTSIGLKRDMNVKDLREIYEGIDIAARKYGMKVLGGDTNEADDIIIDGIALGIAKKVVPRGGAKIGDIIATTGLFGNTAAGLKILLESLSVEEKLRRRILRDVYEPRAYIKEGYILAKRGLVNASIDSSDGLAISLHEIAKMSNVGIEIDNLPITEEARIFAEKNKIDPFDLVFYGGEEYALILTISKENWEEALNEVRKVGGTLIKIGKVTNENGKIIYKHEEEERIIEKKGWQHFIT